MDPLFRPIRGLPGKGPVDALVIMDASGSMAWAHTGGYVGTYPTKQAMALHAARVVVNRLIKHADGRHVNFRVAYFSSVDRGVGGMEDKHYVRGTALDPTLYSSTFGLEGCIDQLGSQTLMAAGPGGMTQTWLGLEAVAKIPTARDLIEKGAPIYLVTDGMMDHYDKTNPGETMEQARVRILGDAIAEIMAINSDVQMHLIAVEDNAPIKIEDGKDAVEIEGGKCAGGDVYEVVQRVMQQWKSGGIDHGDKGVLRFPVNTFEAFNPSCPNGTKLIDTAAIPPGYFQWGPGHMVDVRRESEFLAWLKAYIADGDELGVVTPARAQNLLQYLTVAVRQIAEITNLGTWFSPRSPSCPPRSPPPSCPLSPSHRGARVLPDSQRTDVLIRVYSKVLMGVRLPGVPGFDPAILVSMFATNVQTSLAGAVAKVGNYKAARYDQFEAATRGLGTSGTMVAGGDTTMFSTIPITTDDGGLLMVIGSAGHVRHSIKLGPITAPNSAIRLAETDNMHLACIPITDGTPTPTQAQVRRQAMRGVLAALENLDVRSDAVMYLLLWRYAAIVIYTGDNQFVTEAKRAMTVLFQKQLPRTDTTLEKHLLDGGEPIGMWQENIALGVFGPLDIKGIAKEASDRGKPVKEITAAHTFQRYDNAKRVWATICHAYSDLMYLGQKDYHQRKTIMPSPRVYCYACPSPPGLRFGNECGVMYTPLEYGFAPKGVDGEPTGTTLLSEEFLNELFQLAGNHGDARVTDPFTRKQMHRDDYVRVDVVQERGVELPPRIRIGRALPGVDVADPTAKPNRFYIMLRGTVGAGKTTCREELGRLLALYGVPVSVVSMDDAQLNHRGSKAGIKNTITDFVTTTPAEGKIHVIVSDHCNERRVSTLYGIAIPNDVLRIEVYPGTTISPSTESMTSKELRDVMGNDLDKYLHWSLLHVLDRGATQTNFCLTPAHSSPKICTEVHRKKAMKLFNIPGTADVWKEGGVDPAIAAAYRPMSPHEMARQTIELIFKYGGMPVPDAPIPVAAAAPAAAAPPEFKPNGIIISITGKQCHTTNADGEYAVVAHLKKLMGRNAYIVECSRRGDFDDAIKDFHDNPNPNKALVLIGTKLPKSVCIPHSYPTRLPDAQRRTKVFVGDTELNLKALTAAAEKHAKARK